VLGHHSPGKLAHPGRPLAASQVDAGSADHRNADAGAADGEPNLAAHPQARTPDSHADRPAVADAGAANPDAGAANPNSDAFADALPSDPDADAVGFPDADTGGLLLA
jgi:hypothetical protein